MVAILPTATPKPALAPQPGPQTAMLESSADVVLFGGMAFGGKSWALLFEPIRHLNNPRFRAIIFRRSEPILKQPGGLWDESFNLYTEVGGVPNVSEMYWTFPSGAQVKFAHLQFDKSVYQYKGGQIPLIEFDELTEFEEQQWWYMFSRNRSDCGVRPYIRASCNPDAGSFVRGLVDWYIDPKTGFAIPQRSGIVRWFTRDPHSDQLVWADTRHHLLQRFEHLRGTADAITPKSFTFIPASMDDNPAGMNKNKDYRGSLQLQGIVDRERLMKGNWNIKVEAGQYFRREWWDVVDEAKIPRKGVAARFFDFAATKKELNRRVKGNRDPDYTAGHLMLYTEGFYYTWDSYAAQLGPADVDNMFVAIVGEDLLWAKTRGVRYKLRWEQEGGSSGIQETNRLIMLLFQKLKPQIRAYGGLDAAGVLARGDKAARAKSFSSMLQPPMRRIKLRADPLWNDRYLTHMHHQYDWPHDDEHDATVGAFNELMLGRQRRFRTAVGGARPTFGQSPVGLR